MLRVVRSTTNKLGLFRIFELQNYRKLEIIWNIKAYELLLSF